MGICSGQEKSTASVWDSEGISVEQRAVMIEVNAICAQQVFSVRFWCALLLKQEQKQSQSQAVT